MHAYKSLSLSSMHAHTLKPKHTHTHTHTPGPCEERLPAIIRHNCVESEWRMNEEWKKRERPKDRVGSRGRERER